MKNKKMKKGLFITFEGPEGSGKTTLMRFAKRYLRRKGCAVVETREPGGTAVGEKIRSFVLSLRYPQLEGIGELLLYCAARHQVVKEVICPALKKGKVVLCDRYEDSTFAYQGFGEGVDRAVVHSVNKAATGGLKPRLTFLADVPVKLGLRRSGRTDRIERKSFDFHARVRKGYLTLARREPRRFVVLDGRRPLKEVTELVEKVLERALRKRK